MIIVVCTMHILSFYCVFHQIHFVLLTVFTEPRQYKTVSTKIKKKLYFLASLFTSFHTRVPINFSRSRSLIVSLLKFSQQNVPLAGAISKWDKKPRIRSCSFQSYSSCFVVLSIDKCQTSFVAGACCVTCQSIRRSISMFGPTEP